MSQYPLSIAANATKKKYGMADNAYLIYADLRACGWAQSDAWNVAFQGKGINWTKAELTKEMNKLESLDSVQRRIADIQGRNTTKSEGISPEDLARETSKETILRKLVIAEKKAKYGSPDWLKIVSLEADYNKIKQDEIDKENNIIHYHLPVRYPRTCQDCLIFKNGKSCGK